MIDNAGNISFFKSITCSSDQTWLKYDEKNKVNAKELTISELVTDVVSKMHINGIFFSKLFWWSVRKICSSDRVKFLKFKVEGQEFANILRSLEQFIQTVKG